MRAGGVGLIGLGPPDAAPLGLNASVSTLSPPWSG